MLGLTQSVQDKICIGMHRGSYFKFPEYVLMAWDEIMWEMWNKNIIEFFNSFNINIIDAIWIGNFHLSQAYVKLGWQYRKLFEFLVGKHYTKVFILYAFCTINTHYMSKWLLLNANWVIVQLHHGENKLDWREQVRFDEMMMMCGLCLINHLLLRPRLCKEK